MASGYVASPNGLELFLYSSAQPFTHGGDLANKTWGRNTGIRLNRLRRDGFVSLDAPYAFSSSLSAFPAFTTVPVSFAPSLVATCTGMATGAGAGGVGLALNAVTSVAGFVAVEVRLAASGRPVVGMELQHSDPCKGNFQKAIISWFNGSVRALDALAGQKLLLHVAMADASLFSMNFVCLT
jgi:hypothetical protein